MRSIWFTKPQHWDSRDKAMARWFHGGLIGSMVFAKSGAVRVIDSPTTTEYQKDIAKQIITLTEKLEQSLRAERINC